MNDLYSMVKLAQEDPARLEEIVSSFEPKVKRLMKITDLNNMQDLSQELRIIIMKAASNYDTESIPGFWEWKNRLE